MLFGAYIDAIPTEIALVPMYDSIGHFVLYGIWFYLLHEALGRKTLGMIPLAFLILFPLVALEEFAQNLASTRTFSLIDLSWGVFGMLLVALIFQRTTSK